MYLEKIQFSFIYMLYKAHYYSNRAYIYKANQAISIGISLLLCCALLPAIDFKFSAAIAAIFFIVCFLLFFILQKNVSKRKLFKHRKTYMNRKKYLIPFYTVIFSGLAVVLFFYLRHKGL